MLISILIDPIHFGIERNATGKVSVVLFGGFIGVTFGAEQLRFEPTAGVEMSNGSGQRRTSPNSSAAKTLQVRSKSLTFRTIIWRTEPR